MPQLALAVALEIIFRGLSAGSAVLLSRSQKQIDDTLQAVSHAGYDTKALIDSKKLIPCPNENYSAVLFFTRRFL